MIYLFSKAWTWREKPPSKSMTFFFLQQVDLKQSNECLKRKLLAMPTLLGASLCILEVEVLISITSLLIVQAWGCILGVEHLFSQQAEGPWLDPQHGKNRKTPHAPNNKEIKSNSGLSDDSGYWTSIASLPLLGNIPGSSSPLCRAFSGDVYTGTQGPLEVGF